MPKKKGMGQESQKERSWKGLWTRAKKSAEKAKKEMKGLGQLSQKEREMLFKKSMEKQRYKGK